MLRAMGQMRKAMRAGWKYYRVSQDPFYERVINTRRFLQQYTKYEKMKTEQTRVNLFELEKEEKGKEDKVNEFERIRKNIYDYLKFTKEEASTKAQELKNTADMSSQFSKLLKKLLSYLTLYYESLQALIQGRRQVLQNPQFKFQDGKTVREKEADFQKLLQRIIGKKQ